MSSLQKDHMSILYERRLSVLPSPPVTENLQTYARVFVQLQGEDSFGQLQTAAEYRVGKLVLR